MFVPDSFGLGTRGASLRRVVPMFQLIIGCPLLTSCAQGEGAGSSRNTEVAGESSQEIIGGTAPAKGALEGWGVVALSSGCSGALLTNRHVLTAQHCIRNIDSSPYASYLPISVTLEKPSGLDEVIVASNSIEHAAPYSLENLDYAVLVLDSPISVSGSANEFFRKYHTGADSTLNGKTVFCAGYGMTQLAEFVGGVWVPGGNGMLTSANQVIDDVWSNGTLIRRLHNGVVGAGGDSGSACFFQSGSDWIITGPQSNCPDFDWVNFNNPSSPDFDWSEATAIRECRGAAPSAYRPLLANNIWADVTVSYDSMPPLPLGTAAATVTTTAATFSVDALDAETVQAPRSGKVSVQVTSEPAHTMCPSATVDAPMSGSLTIARRCLDDGLVAALL